jgi:hypothetical protein
MHFKLIIFFILGISPTFAQVKYSKVTINRNMKDTFTFVNLWDYSPDIIKDDSTCRLSRDDGKPIHAADTAHSYFTANCETNVMGGYNLRYCYAFKSKDTIRLVFSDLQGEYASEFYVYIKGDSFYFRPVTIYPIINFKERTSYRVTRQKLTLNKCSFTIDDTIIGNIDAEFIETVTVPMEGTQSHKLYFRGFIKTHLNSQTKK